LPDRVNNPPKDELASAPAAISREELLEGHCFVPPVPRLGTRQDGVNAV
jgi:hypothetical protein